MVGPSMGAPPSLPALPVMMSFLPSPSRSAIATAWGALAPTGTNAATLGVGTSRTSSVSNSGRQRTAGRALRLELEVVALYSHDVSHMVNSGKVRVIRAIPFLQPNARNSARLHGGIHEKG